MSRLFKVTSILVLAFLFANNALGQGEKLDKYYSLDTNKWFAEIPLWVPGFRGALAYGDIEITSSGSKLEKERERLSNALGIEFYFVGRVNVQFKNNLFFQIDAFAGRITSTFTFTPNYIGAPVEYANVTIQGSVPRFIVGYNVFSHTSENHFKIEIIPYVGVKYIDLELNSTFLDSVVTDGYHPQRFEPAIGVYIPMSYKRFKLVTQADYGRLETYQSMILNGGLHYRISPLFEVKLGYSYFIFNHQEVINDKELKVNIGLGGPTFGCGFHF